VEVTVEDIQIHPLVVVDLAAAEHLLVLNLLQEVLLPELLEERQEAHLLLLDGVILVELDLLEKVEVAGVRLLQEEMQVLEVLVEVVEMV